MKSHVKATLPTACSQKCPFYRGGNRCEKIESINDPIKFLETLVLFFYLLKNFKIVIQLQLSAFSPHPSTPPQPIPPPSPFSILPLDFILVSFIVAPVDPSPHYPLPTPLWLLLHCS